ncbi:MAG: hypothetical protein AAFY08_16155, partial [Planctomycetota bacterium]
SPSPRTRPDRRKEPAMPTLDQVIIVNIRSLTIGSDIYEGARDLSLTINPLPTRATRGEGAMRPSGFTQLPSNRAKYSGRLSHTSEAIKALADTTAASVVVTGTNAMDGGTATLTLTTAVFRGLNLPPMNNNEGEQLGQIQVDCADYALT